MPDWLIPTLGIGVPIISIAVAWVGSAKAKEVKADLTTHIAEDNITHANMKDSLDRIEENVKEIRQFLMERRK